MVQQLRTIGWLWTIVGIASAMWGLLLLFYDPHWSWILRVSFGVLAVFCGWVLGASGIPSRFWSLLVAGPILLYAAAYLLLGGVEDALAQAPLVALTATVAIYNLVVVFRTPRNAP